MERYLNFRNYPSIPWNQQLFIQPAVEIMVSMNGHIHQKIMQVNNYPSHSLGYAILVEEADVVSKWHTSPWRILIWIYPVTFTFWVVPSLALLSINRLELTKLVQTNQMDCYVEFNEIHRASCVFRTVFFINAVRLLCIWIFQRKGILVCDCFNVVLLDLIAVSNKVCLTWGPFY